MAVVSAVTTPGGGHSNSVGYTYDAAAPVVSGISPAFGSAAGDTRVTITGSNLFGPATVLFGTTPATAVTPASDEPVAGRPGARRERAGRRRPGNVTISGTLKQPPRNTVMPG